MSGELERIDHEIDEVKGHIREVEQNLRDTTQAIAEAEKHVLEGDRLTFWEPKLASLREEKAFYIKKEEKLQDEAIVLEKSRLACIEAQSTEFNFYDEDENITGARGRISTWAGTQINFAQGNSSVDGNKDEDDDVKKVESSPSIMTKVEGSDVINSAPDASLQGQHRRPHIGNLRSSAMQREDSFNVFGIGIEEDSGVISKPEKIGRNVSEMSISSEVSDVSSTDQPYTVGKFFSEFFDASEKLLLAQGESTKKEKTSRNNSRDTPEEGPVSSLFHVSEELIVTGDKDTSSSKPKQSRPQLQPAESAHDFSVFGKELYNDD